MASDPLAPFFPLLLFVIGGTTGIFIGAFPTSIRYVLGFDRWFPLSRFLAAAYGSETRKRILGFEVVLNFLSGAVWLSGLGFLSAKGWVPTFYGGVGLSERALGLLFPVSLVLVTLVPVIVGIIFHHSEFAIYELMRVDSIVAIANDRLIFAAVCTQLAISMMYSHNTATAANYAGILFFSAKALPVTLLLAAIFRRGGHRIQLWRLDQIDRVLYRIGLPLVLFASIVYIPPIGQIYFNMVYLLAENLGLGLYTFPQRILFIDIAARLPIIGLGLASVGVVGYPQQTGQRLVRIWDILRAKVKQHA